MGLLNWRPDPTRARPCETHSSTIEVSRTPPIESPCAGMECCSAAANVASSDRAGAETSAKSAATASAATSRQRDRTEANQDQPYYAKYSFYFHIFTIAPAVVPATTPQ
jgi:hypothetical protein